MIVITGGLGFIGSNILKKLNKNNEKEILLVDNKNKKKTSNIKNSNYLDLIDKNKFLKNLKNKKYKNIKCIFHQGACTNTQEQDLEFLIYNNYNYSKEILEYSNNNNIKFIYASSASVYGNLKTKMNERIILKKSNLKNYYAISKLLFDNFFLKNKNKLKSTIGLRYFNVYGINEFHKKNMSSPILTFYNQIKKHKICKIFGEYDGYQKGMHSRDFIHINDVVKINLWASKQKISDIINVGTGKSHTFKYIAKNIIKKLGYGKIQFIDFPKKFKNKYQSYTCANLAKLRYLGYKNKFIDLEEGISNYLKELKLVSK